MRGLFQDLRYGLSVLVKNPSFTAVAVITLALGIGANTAIFSVVNATLLRPFPFHDPDRLMFLFTMRAPKPGEPAREQGTWSNPKYQTLRQHQRVFDDLAIYFGATYNLTGVDEAQRLWGEVISANYFSVLGIHPKVGRTFLADDDTPAAERSVVLGYGLWQRAFGADRNVVGRLIQLNHDSYRVLGVLPKEFHGLTGRAEVWLPAMTIGPQALAERWGHRFQVVARRKAAFTEPEVKSAVLLLGALVDEAHPSPRGDRGWSAVARSLNETRLDRDFRTAVLVLFSAVILVVLIACVNVANLLLARSDGRRREIAIRLAIGSSRARIVRLLLAESLLLALGGATASLLVAQWGLSVLGALNPAGNTFGQRLPGLTIIGLSSVRLDTAALLFTFATALVTGLLFGLAPALHATRHNVTNALKIGESGSRGFARMRAFTARNFLVLGEVAMAVVLVVASGLMIRSFGKLLATDAGINADNVLTFRTDLSRAQYTPAAATAFFTQLQRRIAALPGVESVGVSEGPPLAGGYAGTRIRFRDRADVPSGSEPDVGVKWVSGEYFQTLRVPLIRGRWFTPEDRQGTPKVVLISETAARRFWPAEDPIGKPIAVGQGGFGDSAEIVGVVGDIRYRAMETPPYPDVYLSYEQSPLHWGMIFVRSSGDSLALAAAVRSTVKALNKDLVVYDMKTMRERIGDATGKMRFSALLLAIFAALAVALAAIGIYGVTSYAVAQRTREVGIRIALGAKRGDVTALVVRDAAYFIVPGIVLGLASALAVSRVLTRLLYQVKANDPLTYVTLAIGLGALALLASYIPARRAARVDPMVALRYE